MPPLFDALLLARLGLDAATAGYVAVASRTALSGAVLYAPYRLA